MTTFFNIPVRDKFKADTENFYRGKETSAEFAQLLEWASNAAQTNDSSLYTNHLPFGQVRLGKMNEISFRIPFRYEPADDVRVPDVEKANELAGFLQKSGLFDPKDVNASLTDWLANYSEKNGKGIQFELSDAASEVTTSLAQLGEPQHPVARALLGVHAKTGAFFKKGDGENKLTAFVPGGENIRNAAIASLQGLSGLGVKQVARLAT